MISRIRRSWSVAVPATLVFGLLTSSIGQAWAEKRSSHAVQQDSRAIALADYLKAPRGERYDALVPDTLDLAERCRLAVRGIVWSVSDTGYDHEPYSAVCYDSRPAYATFGNGIGLTSSPKYAEALPMLRIASGSEESLDVESGFMRCYLARVSPDDGLHYSTRITPFSRKDRPWHNDAYPIPPGGKRVKDEDMMDVYLNSRHIMALMAWYERSGNKEWLPLIEKAVRGMEKAAIVKGDYAYYPDGGIGMPFSRPRSGWAKTEEARGEAEGGEGSMFMYHGGQIRAFARYYELTGDKNALEMARKLSRYVLKARFWGAPPSDVSPNDHEKSVFDALETVDSTGRANGCWHGHSHGRASVLRGLLELAEADNDKRLMEFVKNSYEFTVWSMSTRRDEGRDEFLSPGFELNPRVLGTARVGVFGETCMIADMTALAIRLTDDGMGDYWDDVDRWVRNHLVERQLVDLDLMKRISESRPPIAPDNDPQVTQDNVLRNSLGLFVVFSYANSANNLTSKDSLNTLVCCSCNGSQALYYAWESTVRKKGDWVEVNLLLNRASPWLDVDSYLPYEGKVVLKNKTAKNARVRLSEWMKLCPLTAKINDRAVSVTRRGDYVEFTGLKPKDVVTIEFPMIQTVEQMGKFKCTFRGGTLCKIEPEADPDHYPIYRRDKYLQNQAPMMRVRRYVAPEPLGW